MLIRKIINTLFILSLFIFLTAATVIQNPSVTLRAIGGSSFTTPLTTNPYTISADDAATGVLYYNAAGVVNLPTATIAGQNLMIYNTGTNVISVTPNGTETIVTNGVEGGAGVAYSLASGAGKYVTLVSDGVKWVTLGIGGAVAVVCDLGGSRTQGALTDTWGADTAITRTPNPGTNGEVASCSSTTMNKGCIYTGSTTATDLKMCVYSWTDKNTGAKVECSNALTSNTIGWQTVTFASNFTITATSKYVIVVALNDTSGTITVAYDSSANLSYYKSTSGFYDALPATMDWEVYAFLGYASEGNLSWFVTDGSCP